MGKKKKQSSSSSSSHKSSAPSSSSSHNDPGGQMPAETREWLKSQLEQLPPENLQNLMNAFMQLAQAKYEEEEEEEEEPGYNKVVQGLLDMQRKEELGLIEKKIKEKDEEEHPIQEPMDWDKFYKSDYPVGFYKLIDGNTFVQTFQNTMRFFGMDTICEETLLYYYMMANILSPFGQDARRFILVQKLRKEGDNPRANIRPETYEYYVDTDYNVSPSVEYLKRIITQKFIPKEKQDPKDDILDDKELVRCAKFVINSKKRRKKDFEENSSVPWSELYDNNTLESPDYDIDTNDPENKIRFSNESESASYKFYKTEGARIRRLMIGSWSPCPCYDEQFRIKISPLFRKIYYRFFTFLPSYHSNFKDEQEREKYFAILTKAIYSSSSLSQYFQNEMARFKNSSILSMEIDFSSITGIHLQKCFIDKRVFKEELCLLVLDVNQPPNFYSRQVKNIFEEGKKIPDFTDGCAASTSHRHYICGSEREMKRIASILIQSDTTGVLRKLYREGMKNIDLESDSKPAESSSSTSLNSDISIMLNNYKLTTNKKVLGECIYSHLKLNYSQHLWEKFLTTPVTEASQQTGIDLRNRGYSEMELSDLKLYQILGNEKFNDIYFSFCTGRFYKTSEYHHLNGKCCSVNEKPIQTAVTEPITQPNQETKPITKEPKGTPFKFVNIGSVVEYPLPPNFPPYKKK